MNIFYIDKDPVLAAQYHNDPHVVKMCLETAQILCTVQRNYITPSEAKAKELYRSTHLHHPCTVWASNSLLAYMWTYRLFEALLAEYKHRYNKTHACSYLCEALVSIPERFALDDFRKRRIFDYKSAKFVEGGALKVKQKIIKAKFPQPPCAMPVQYRLSHGQKPNPKPDEVSALHSYRNYYVNGKSHLNRYTNRNEPEWFNNYRKENTNNDDPDDDFNDPYAFLGREGII